MSVSWSPPGIYRNEVDETLTHAAEVLEGRAAFPDDRSDGAVLLNETVYFRGNDQLLYRVRHRRPLVPSRFTPESGAGVG